VVGDGHSTPRAANVGNIELLDERRAHQPRRDAKEERAGICEFPVDPLPYPPPRLASSTGPA